MSVLSYRRIDKSGREVIIVLNFTPVERLDFTIGVPQPGEYTEFFSSDNTCYGGSGMENGILTTSDGAWGEFQQYLTFKLPAYGACFLRRTPKRSISDSTTTL